MKSGAQLLFIAGTYDFSLSRGTLGQSNGALGRYNSGIQLPNGALLHSGIYYIHTALTGNPGFNLLAGTAVNLFGGIVNPPGPGFPGGAGTGLYTMDNSLNIVFEIQGNILLSGVVTLYLQYTLKMT